MQDGNTPNPDEPRDLCDPPHLINAMIDVRGENGESFGTLLLVLSDIDEEIIARYGSHGFFQAHGHAGTKEDIFRFMADNFDVYASEFVGGLTFMLNIDEKIWREAEHTFSFATRHFVNNDTNEVPLNLILRFVRSKPDGEPPLDAALRRTFSDAIQSQFPVFADAFGIGDGFITLGRIERELLKRMFIQQTARLMKTLGVQEVKGTPIDRLLDNVGSDVIGFLEKENVPPERAAAMFQKIELILPLPIDLGFDGEPDESEDGEE